MHASDEPAPQSLTLPMPRWPFLWPALLVPAYLINPAFHLTRSWNGPLRFRLLGILLVVASLVCGALLSVGALASHHWRELRIERGCIFLKPAFQVPHWARWCYNPGQSRTFKEGFLEFSLDQASLEWVGKTLLLHGHPEMDVRLGRGPGAEHIAQWLMAQGLPTPVGR